MPGSRAQELKYLVPTFLETAALLHQTHPDVQFISAFPNPNRLDQFQGLRRHRMDLPITTFLGQSISVMAAADAILIASGTGSLEAMLVKRPTIVAYKMSPFTFWLAKKLIKVPYIALPNLLANREIIPEFIQDNASPDRLAEALFTTLDFAYDTQKICTPFTEIHQMLKKNAGQTGAAAISQIIRRSMKYLAGVDEAGRGPLAGPVVASAVILLKPIPGLRDSKKLSEPKRNALCHEIKAQALAWSLGIASVEEIDRINILQATLLAMQRAIAGLYP